MELNTQALAQSIIDVFSDHAPTDMGDSSDMKPREVGHEKFAFEVFKHVDRRLSSRRGDIVPVGIIVYTVTVEGKWAPFDDDENDESALNRLYDAGDWLAKSG